MVKIAVFASGSGSNYEAIMRFFAENPDPNLEIALVVADQADAKVISRAERWQTPVVVIEQKKFGSKQAFEEEILKQLQIYNIDFIALAGYMRIIGTTLLDRYVGKIINLHPSLLPAFTGLDAVGQALKAGVRVTGVTVHFVDEGLDTGPIICQEAVTISLKDTHQSLTEKIHAIEHRLYPRVIQACALGEIYLDNYVVKRVRSGKQCEF